jgi:hypothetical protein
MKVRSSVVSRTNRFKPTYLQHPFLNQVLILFHRLWPVKYFLQVLLPNIFMHFLFPTYVLPIVTVSVSDP